MLKRHFDIKWLVLAVALAVLAALFGFVPRKLMPYSLLEGGLDKLLHVLICGAITFLVVLSMKTSLSLRSALLILFAMSAGGAVCEIAQRLVQRQTSLVDLAADVFGVVSVLLISTAGGHQLQRIKTEPASQLCFVAAAAFITGFLVVPVTLVSRNMFAPDEFQRQQAARYFFYSTMFELLDGNYNSEDDSISEGALETFKQHRSGLGDVCSFVIFNDPYNQSRQRAGVFAGSVFFPSGDHFAVDIVRTGAHFVIERFEPLSWDAMWSEVISDTERYYRLGYSPVYYEP